MAAASKRFAFLLGILFVCLGVMSVAPLQAHAASHLAANEIYLGGVCYAKGHPDTATYNESTGVLTLNDYEGGTIQVYALDNLEKQLTIDLKGDSTIYCTGELGYNVGIWAADSKVGVEITSSEPASIRVDAQYMGIQETTLTGVYVKRNLVVSGQAQVFVSVDSSSAQAVSARGITCSDGGVVVKDHGMLSVYVHAGNAESCFGIESYGTTAPVLSASTDNMVGISCYADNGISTFGVHQQHFDTPLDFCGIPYVSLTATNVLTDNYYGGKDTEVPGYQARHFGNDHSYRLEQGWVKVGGKWRYFLSVDKGFVTNEFRSDKNKTYYFDAEGYMVTGWQKIGGSWYFFDTSSGAMRIGWVKSGTKWYYMKTGGIMATGWQKVGTKWYYLDTSSGAMKTGWQKINGKWYYFESSGAMKVGWLKSGGKWYYLQGSGAMATGWLKIGNTWYYFSVSGVMATGTQTINGKTYRFSSSRAWIS